MALRPLYRLSLVRTSIPSSLCETNAGNWALTVDKSLAESGVICDCYDGTPYYSHKVFTGRRIHDTLLLCITNHSSLCHVCNVHTSTSQQSPTTPKDWVYASLTHPWSSNPSRQYFKLSPRLIIWVYFCTFFFFTSLLAFDNMADLWQVPILCTATDPPSGVTHIYDSKPWDLDFFRHFQLT